MADDSLILIRAVDRGGKLLTLQDGTQWDVYFLDSIYSIDWRPDETRVRLRKPAIGGLPPYTTELVKDGQAYGVRARQIVQPAV